MAVIYEINKKCVQDNCNSINVLSLLVCPYTTLTNLNKNNKQRQIRIKQS